MISQSIPVICHSTEPHQSASQLGHTRAMAVRNRHGSLMRSYHFHMISFPQM